VLFHRNIQFKKILLYYYYYHYYYVVYVVCSTTTTTIFSRAYTNVLEFKISIYNVLISTIKKGKYTENVSRDPEKVLKNPGNNFFFFNLQKYNDFFLKKLVLFFVSEKSE